MEIGQETMAWFTHLPINWIGFTYEDGHLSYGNLFLLLFLLLLILPFSFGMILSFLTFVLSIVLAIYKKMNNLSEDILSTSWHKPRHFFARYLTKLGKTMHDHEIIGMEHLPEGPGIIVFYHGTFHIDYFFLLSRLYLQRGKLCILVADKALFYVPGLKPLLQVMAGIPGSKAECVEMLKKGCLLGIAPGGAREAFFSDENYNLLWGKRKGFAQLALEAKVPIIPMFTKNIKEVCRGYGRTRLSRWLYEKTRFISTPIYGYFPVKLCTYLGEPIPYGPNTTAEELAEKTKVAIENLRDQYQKVPGNILRAVSERFGKHNKD